MKYNPGTILCRNKGPAVHYGNYFSDTHVLHIRPGYGCEITTLEEFSAGQNVWTLDTPVSAGFEERAQEVMSRSYSLLTDNCQHIANYVASGKYSSPQVTGTLLGAATFTALSDKGEWWQRALAGGVIGLLLSRA
jgi:hypothetical protein